LADAHDNGDWVTHPEKHAQMDAHSNRDESREDCAKLMKKAKLNSKEQKIANEHKAWYAG